MYITIYIYIYIHTAFDIEYFDLTGLIGIPIMRNCEQDRKMDYINKFE